MGERWLRELGTGGRRLARGTYGFTDDDEFMAIVRFESREAAERELARAPSRARGGRRWRRSSTARPSSTTATTSR